MPERLQLSSVFGVAHSESGAGAGLGTPLPEDEREAMYRCQLVEADAFRLIVERYADLLYGTAYLMLQDRGQAEDAVQDAFLASWRSIRSFSLDRSLRPWLLRILVNQALRRRRRKLLPLVPLHKSADVIVSRVPGPEVAAEREWERSEVARALTSLDSGSAKVVVLRFFAELSVSEVALALSLPEGTVKSRLHRALRKLQADLVERKVWDRREQSSEPDKANNRRPNR